MTDFDEAFVDWRSGRAYYTPTRGYFVRPVICDDSGSVRIDREARAKKALWSKAVLKAFTQPEFHAAAMAAYPENRPTDEFSRLHGIDLTRTECLRRAAKH
jgi:hypothetical protein